MLYPPAQAKVYNVALTPMMFSFSGPRCEKVGHPWFRAISSLVSTVVALLIFSVD